MPSTSRVSGRGRARTAQPPLTQAAEESDDPLALSPVKAKKRARVVLQAEVGLRSGLRSRPVEVEEKQWIEDGEGGEADLVPPSDEEELEVWRNDNASQATSESRPDKGKGRAKDSPFVRMSSKRASTHSDSQSHPSQLALSITSYGTSQTIPLNRSMEGLHASPSYSDPTEHSRAGSSSSQSSITSERIDWKPTRRFRRLFSSPPLGGPLSPRQRGKSPALPELDTPSRPTRPETIFTANHADTLDMPQSPSALSRPFSDRLPPTKHPSGISGTGMVVDEKSQGPMAVDDQQSSVEGDLGGASDRGTALVEDNMDSGHHIKLVMPVDTDPERTIRQSSGDQPDQRNRPFPLNLDRDSLSPDPISWTQAREADKTPPGPSPSKSDRSVPQSTQPTSPARRPPSPLHSPSPSPPIADLALEQFRTARTFRTRTKLQLQPYTKERQLYEAALRRGGLKAHKRVIPTDQDSLPKEILPVSEEPAPESSGSEVIIPERIVIGNTPPPPRVLELVDADHDEYFTRFGRAAEDEEEDARGVLQDIARERLREVKVARRKAREARKAERAFARLIRGQEEAESGNVAAAAESEDEVSSVAVFAQRAEMRQHRAPLPPRPVKALRTSGRPKTYSKKDQMPVLERAESEGLPELPPPLPPPLYDPITTSSAGLPSIHTPGSPDVGLDMDVDLPLDQSDFVVDFNDFGDTPRPPAKRAQTISSDSDTSSNGESSSGAEDKRVRIARRMLPAAMLKKLEQEAAMKDLRKAESKRRDARRGVDSPARPGRAVIRRAAGQVDMEDLLGEVADEEEESLPRTYDPETPTRVMQRELVVISDNSSDESQALEDDGAGRSLARLYQGDFESILAGRRKLATRKPKGGHTTRMRPKTARRPALGLVRRMKPPGSTSKEYQTRLEFPNGDISPTRPRSTKKAKMTSNGTRKSHKPRPAIQLDDHVIFATADFAFETEVEQSQPRTPRDRPLARIFRRTTSRTMSEPDVVDAGIGKARSWANFDKFPIDFGISPLPSGLYCSADTIVGDGRVAHLVDMLDRSAVGADDGVGICLAYDVELRGDMAPSSISAVLDIVFESLQRSVLGFTNAAEADPPDLAPVAFLARYTSMATVYPLDMNILQMRCLDATHALTEQLNGALASGNRLSKPARDATLQARWELLSLALHLSMALGIASPVVETSSTGLLRHLLSVGFDKTVKPLKAMLRGEAENAEISDPTIIAWVAVMHTLAAYDRRFAAGDTSFICLAKALESSFHLDQTGPIAAERIWFLIFGLCAISQFDVHGRITATFNPSPRWQLVRRAVSLIKISHNEEAEERAKQDQLRGRDRYIKTIMARCVRLSSAWKWHFDKESFSVATKDLGVIFKERQYRNLPTEHPVDFPAWITRFDVSLTANEDTKDETAFELYLRLVCVAASDIIGSTTSLVEAQQAERGVQRLIMSIIPVSPVRFNRILPPAPKQLGQLVNRYAAVVAGCYFSPTLLGWLLANSKKWAPFDSADFESRQISIRGLMYLAVALRHHEQSLKPVVNCFAEIMGTLQSELEDTAKEGARRIARTEVERTMILVVACFKMIILNHSYDVETQLKPSYPDPSLLHESWISRAFALDLNKDLTCATEVVSTIQVYLDTRSAALPRLAKQRREIHERAKEESEDSYSFGMGFTDGDLLALGGEPQTDDPIQKADEEFGQIIITTISPNIYRLLSDMLPLVLDETLSTDAMVERQVFIMKLTKCWSDCAGVAVVEQNASDGWTRYIGSFGKESWQRLRNEQGRLQVGLHFMLNVAKIDPSCFKHHEEDFISLLFQAIVTDRLSIEHEYFSAMMDMPGVLGHPLLSDLSGTEYVGRELDRTNFMQVRGTILELIFASIPHLFRSQHTASSTKTLIYRCVNLLVSSLIANEKSIPITKVIHKESYHAFAVTTVKDLRRLTGDFFTPTSIPTLKAFI